MGFQGHADTPIGCPYGLDKPCQRPGLLKVKWLLETIGAWIHLDDCRGWGLCLNVTLKDWILRQTVYLGNNGKVNGQGQLILEQTSALPRFSPGCNWMQLLCLNHFATPMWHCASAQPLGHWHQWHVGRWRHPHVGLHHHRCACGADDGDPVVLESRDRTLDLGRPMPRVWPLGCANSNPLIRDRLKLLQLAGVTVLLL